MTATGHQTSTIIQAVESAWQVIQERHPDVPDVAVAMGSGSMARGMKLGHFAAERWNRDGNRIPELFVGGEGLARGATDVLGTLLHEAAHGVADTRSIADTSRRGKYHNRKFKALAEEMGLTCEQTGTIGWSATAVTASTAPWITQRSSVPLTTP